MNVREAYEKARRHGAKHYDELTGPEKATLVLFASICTREALAAPLNDDADHVRIKEVGRRIGERLALDQARSLCAPIPNRLTANVESVEPDERHGFWRIGVSVTPEFGALHFFLSVRGVDGPPRQVGDSVDLYVTLP